MSDKKSLLHHIIICLIAVLVAILLAVASPVFMMLFGFIGLAYGALSYKLTKRIALPNIMLGAFLFLGLTILDMTKTQDNKIIKCLLLISVALALAAFLVSYALTVAGKKLCGDWEAGRYNEKNAIGYILLVLTPVFATLGAYFAESLDTRYGGPLIVYIVGGLPAFILLGGILPYLLTDKIALPCAIWSASTFFTSVSVFLSTKTSEENINGGMFFISAFWTLLLFAVCFGISVLTKLIFERIKRKKNANLVVPLEENEIPEPNENNKTD